MKLEIPPSLLELELKKVISELREAIKPFSRLPIFTTCSNEDCKRVIHPPSVIPYCHKCLKEMRQTLKTEVEKIKRKK